MSMNKYFLLIFSLLLPSLMVSCTTSYSPMNTKYPDLNSYMSDMSIVADDDSDVVVCSGYNCNFKTHIKFTDSDRETIHKIFKSRDFRTPYEERQMIATAVATIETVVGPIVGTENDKGGVLENEFIGNIEKQDCVDESASTTSYLKYFQDNELIFMHSVVVPQSRGALIDGRWPHFSATIRDKKNKKQFVIDSWFRDNGEPPVVMELQDWVYDWRRANEVQNEELN